MQERLVLEHVYKLQSIFLHFESSSLLSVTKRTCLKGWKKYNNNYFLSRSDWTVSFILLLEHTNLEVSLYEMSYFYSVSFFLLILRVSSKRTLKCKLFIFWWTSSLKVKRNFSIFTVVLWQWVTANAQCAKVPGAQKQQTEKQQCFFLSHQFCDAKLAFWNPHSSLQMMREIKYSYLHWTKKKIFPNSALTCYFCDAWYPVRHCQR